MMIDGYIKLFAIIIFIAAILQIPICFTARRKGKSSMRYFLFFMSFFLIIFVTIILFGLPINFEPEKHVLNLTPLRWLWEGRIKQRVLMEIIPNIMIYIPLGIFTPVAFKQMRRFYMTTSFVFIVTFNVELFQYFIGRSSDIDDLIANALGGIIGYGIWRLL